MPCLKYIIENATTTELRLLRGKTIECVSLIGLAVGSDKVLLWIFQWYGNILTYMKCTQFRMDANAVMGMLLKAQTEGDLPDDDPQTSYLISAWARMCRILGEFAVGNWKQFKYWLFRIMILQNAMDNYLKFLVF
jgi:hypothetical protein